MPGDAREPLRLQLPSELPSVERARQSVGAFLRDLSLSPRARYAVELILEEMIMNAVMHAHREPGRHVLDLTVSVQRDQIVLRFEDDGVEFDPLRAPERQRPASIEDASPGGLGLQLVRTSARHIGYERRAGRNVVTITVATV